ncbi:MAG: tRNA (adenosine(37)-N6)-threonylcarbamoyltransferase complex dimerization subunit type 1 TsaB [Oscillospiraceae bacterium]|nr:tRNA (adenosine(37)-N6)-threonylcarbamoyltransferase complex dimerization subunit type 1 TsaB [Oscillospiraceae bacterium]
MTILGVESSAVSAGAAVLKDGKIISESYLNVGLTHSETLMTLVDTCLKNAGLTADGIDAFAVSKGPGSFTGIRIGISAVKGMCFGSGKPVYGISTLEAMAYGAAAEDVIICPVMDARCNQVYNALFTFNNKKLTRLCPDRAIKLNELYDEIKNTDKRILLIGDGSDITKKYFEEQNFANFSVFSEIFKFQRACGVAFAAFLRYNEGDSGETGDALQPAYLRLAQAERERQQRSEKK